MVEILLLYLLLGGLAGLLAGMLGVGGGAVIVPVLVFLFQLQNVSDVHIMHLALGTSLATITVTALSSVIAHHRLGSINWHLVLWLAPGLMIGAAIGAVCADRVASITLQRLFGLFEIGMALYMFMGARVTSAIRTPIAKSELVAVGAVIGGVSSLLGIGGGTLTVPYLSWRGRVMREAVAIASACGFPIALAGSAGYLLAGLDALGLPSLTIGYIYWPALLAISSTSLLMAPLGARIAHRMAVGQLKRLFALILMVIGVAMVTPL